MMTDQRGQPDSRERVLARIRDSLRVNRELLEAQAAAYQPPHPRGPFIPSELDVVEQFRSELSALHARVYLCDGAEQAIEQVLLLLEAAGARVALSWALEELPLPGLAERLAATGIRLVEHEVASEHRAAALDALDGVPVGISGADAAIAESASMIVLSGAGRGRLASLLPPMHIALLPADRIVRTLPEAFDLLRARFGDTLFRDRSNLVLISGPSRTADIELSLTLGVHGPRDIHAVVIR